MSKEALLRFIKFALSSLVGGTVDMVLVWLLTSYVFDGYLGDVIITPIVSFESSVIVGFTFCWCFVWNDRVSRKGSKSFLKHLAAYNASNIGIFGLRMMLVVLIESIFSCNLVIINLISRILAGLLNFVISDKVIFRKVSCCSNFKP